MNTKKRNVLNILLIIVLIVNIITLITLITRPHFKFFIEYEKHFPENRRPGDFICNELNLDSSQTIRFGELKFQHHDTLQKLAAQMKNTRQMLITEMMKESPHDSLLFSLADETGRLHASIKKINIIHYLNIRKICNNEQKVKLDSIFKGIFCCQDKMYGHHRPKPKHGKCEFFKKERHFNCNY